MWLMKKGWLVWAVLFMTGLADPCCSWTDHQCLIAGSTFWGSFSSSLQFSASSFGLADQEGKHVLHQVQARFRTPPVRPFPAYDLAYSGGGSRAKPLPKNIHTPAGLSQPIIFGIPEVDVPGHPRIRVSSAAYPFNVVGLLESGCSGTIVGPCHVLTAGHCVYSHERGEYTPHLGFHPGQNGRFVGIPVKAKDFRISSKWLWQEDFNADYAIISLQEKIGTVRGWMGFGFNLNENNVGLNIAGYPADRPPGSMWFDYCGNVHFDYDTLKAVHHGCEVAEGNSGSPMWVYAKDTRFREIRAIHNGARITSTGGVPYASVITPAVTAELKEWISQLQC